MIRHHVVPKEHALLTNVTLQDVNVKLDGTVTNVKATIVRMSRVKMAVHAFLSALELDANVKIITLETFVKKWTHSHMHTKPQTALPVRSNSFLLSTCPGHSDLPTISSGMFLYFFNENKIRERSNFK